MSAKKESGIETALDKSLTAFFEKLSQWEESVALKVKLTPRQCHALSEIGECAPVRMKPLSQRLGITTGTMTIMADRLEKLGLVERRSDSGDKRAFLLVPTAKGERVYREHLSDHRLLSRKFLATLEDGEAETLITLIEKVSAAL